MVELGRWLTTKQTGQMVFDPRLSQPSSGGAGTDPKPSAHRVSSYVNPSDTYSGLEPWLPDGVAAHLAMPFFSAEQPDILILLASRQSSISSFGRGEVAFVRNIGVALSANRVHQKLLIADKAKTSRSIACSLVIAQAHAIEQPS